MKSLIQIASVLVPGPQRSDWLREWESELWYAEHALSSLQTVSFCLGSFRDAFWLRRNRPRTEQSSLDSPGRCLLVLIAVCLACFALTAGRVNDLRSFATVTMVSVFSCIVLPSVSTWTVRADSSVQTFRWWGFLACKFLAVVSTLYCARGLAVHGILVLCIIGFRWALQDQRQRCPVCLCRLHHPVRVGTYSQSFLGWNGTEFLCAKGHGVLYVGHETDSWGERLEWTCLEALFED